MTYLTRQGGIHMFQIMLQSQMNFMFTKVGVIGRSGGSFSTTLVSYKVEMLVCLDVSLPSASSGQTWVKSSSKHETVCRKKTDVTLTRCVIVL